MPIYTIQLKRGKALSWLERNIVLEVGEPGFETDTGRLKIGNGRTAWNDLPYVGSSIFSALTHEDFPKLGRADTLYRATQEKSLYQWNEIDHAYELLISGDYVTNDDLDDYAKLTFTQELYDNITALTNQEILEICK